MVTINTNGPKQNHSYKHRRLAPECNVNQSNDCAVSSLNAHFQPHFITNKKAVVVGGFLKKKSRRRVDINSTILGYVIPVVYEKLISRKGAVYNTTKYI